MYKKNVTVTIFSEWNTTMLSPLDGKCSCNAKGTYEAKLAVHIEQWLKSVIPLAHNNIILPLL